VAISFIGGGNQSTQRKPPTCRKSLSNFITYCCIEYTLPWTGFELTTLVVIGTDCTGSCKSNYHTINTTTATHKRLWHSLYWHSKKKWRFFSFSCAWGHLRFLALCLVYPKLQVSLDCPFLIAPLGFSNVYLKKIIADWCTRRREITGQWWTYVVGFMTKTPFTLAQIDRSKEDRCKKDRSLSSVNGLDRFILDLTSI
jgi:hypothetical protein